MCDCFLNNCCNKAVQPQDQSILHSRLLSYAGDELLYLYKYTLIHADSEVQVHVVNFSFKPCRTRQRNLAYPSPSPHVSPCMQNVHHAPVLPSQHRFKQEESTHLPLKNFKFVAVVSAPAFGTGNASYGNVLTPNGTLIRFSAIALNSVYTSWRTLL